MKRLSIILCTVAVLLLTMGTVSASAQYYMNIRTSNGTSAHYVVTDIDSIWFTDSAVPTDDNGGVEKPITFAASFEKTTSASNTESIDKYIGTFSVWSTKILDNDASNAPMVIFCGEETNSIITFYEDKRELNHWTYNPYRYWDKTATYDFVAVSPNANIIKYNKPENVADNAGIFVTTNSAGYTLIGQNLQSKTAPAESELQFGFKGSYGEDTDLMTSDKVSINGANGVTGNVNLQFKHILAKLNIAIAKDPLFDNVKVLIKSVKITGLDDTGTYVESNLNTESGWTTSSTNPNYTLSWENTNGVELLNGTGEGDRYQAGKFLYFIESLVLPQSIETYNEKLVIDYVIVSGNYTESYNYMLNLHDSGYSVYDNFMDGNKYTIKFTLRPNAITFDATIDDWTY